MPQSWPSQWIVLFLVFLMSFVLVLVLSFFVSVKQPGLSSTMSCSLPSLNWVW